MLAPLHTIKCIKILEEYKTKGSAPLKVIGEDGNLYVAKFTNERHPYKELINEVLCGYLAKCWGFISPDIVLITFPETVVKQFVYSNRYKPEYFKNSFFGSKLIEPYLDFSNYIAYLPKGTYNNFQNGLDLLKIGCFDHWIGNKDRRPESTNIILATNFRGKFDMVPIDHTAAFAYQSYNDLRDIMVNVDKTILQCGFVKSVCNFENNLEVEKLYENIEIAIQNSLDELEFIFEQVPKEWGFSKRAKQSVKQFLTDEDRNKRMAKKYLQYLTR